jgi:hypothetical protein
MTYHYRIPLDAWASPPRSAGDLRTALRGALGQFLAPFQDSGELWAAGPGGQRLRGWGGALLFRSAVRSVHVAGDGRLAELTRAAVAGGTAPGWSLHPVRESETPLEVLEPLLPTRCYGILTRAGFRSVEELEATPDPGLARLRGAGPKFLAAVRAALGEAVPDRPEPVSVAAPADPGQVARRRRMLARSLEPGATLRNHELVELLARSSMPPSALRLIADALNAEPPPPVDPTVAALLDTAGEIGILDYYTRSRR